MPSLKGPIIATILMPLFTFAMYQSALEVAAGRTHEFEGKNAAIKNLLYWLGGELGTTGSVVVGAIVSLGAVCWLVKTLRQRKQIA